jgi:hypothetical protein
MEIVLLHPLEGVDCYWHRSYPVLLTVLKGESVTDRNVGSVRKK